MKTKPIVGQTVYSLNIGNAARHRQQELTPMIVCAVGRKYFTVHPVDYPPNKIQFGLDDWRQHTNYSADHALYESEQEWKEEEESTAICRLLGNLFQHGSNRLRLSLEKLRQINAILIAE